MVTWSFIVVSEHTELGVTLATSHQPLATSLATPGHWCWRCYIHRPQCHQPQHLAHCCCCCCCCCGHNMWAGGTRDGMSGNLIGLPPAVHHLLIYTSQEDSRQQPGVKCSNIVRGPGHRVGCCLNLCVVSVVCLLSDRCIVTPRWPLLQPLVQILFIIIN